MKIGNRVKPNANAIVKNSEECGFPTDGLFEELDQSRGTIVNLHPNADYVIVKWDDDDMKISYLVAHLIELKPLS